MLKVNAKVNSIYILLIILGSFFLSTVGSILEMNIQPLMWSVNITILALALIVILFHLLQNKPVIVFWPFMIFWILYLLRMFIELNIKNVYTNTFSSPLTYYIYGLGLCFAYSLSIAFIDKIDFDFLEKWFFRILFIILALSIIYNSVLNLDEASTQRSTGSDNIGPLTYGHLGVSLFLISLHFSFNKSFSKKAGAILGMVLGGFIIFLASSRSPVLALIICVIAYLFLRSGLIKGIKYLGYLLIPIILFWSNIMELLAAFQTSLINRIMKTVETADASGRELIYEQAISQIKEAPLIGNSLLVNQGVFKGNYPHNLFLESLMSTGIIGTVFLLIALFVLLKKGFKLILSQNKYAWIALIFLQYFLFSMVSKSVYTNTMLWYFGVLLLIVSRKPIKV